MNDDNEEEYGSLAITKKAIIDTCMKHGLYVVPELNDVLYLHYKGFGKISELDEYVNVKTLWLNNNAITKIEGLSMLKNLSTLYLQDNLIETIEGLDDLESLETLILSHNYISEITGLANCNSLTSIEVDNNQIRTSQALTGLTERPSLEILNISHNKIEDVGVLEIIEKLPNLKVLRMEGNPFIRQITNYRRKVINILPNLRFLDDNPVTPNDRRLAAAWLTGGKEAEIEERYKINEESGKKMKDNMNEFRRLKREATLENGGKIEDYPELMSSDDEQKPQLLKKKYDRIAKEDALKEKKKTEEHNTKESTGGNEKNDLTFFTESRTVKVYDQKQINDNDID